MMKQALLFSLLAGSALGCASHQASTMASDQPSAKHRRRAAEQSTFENSAGARQMGLENETGVYDSGDIEDTMSAHLEEVRDCHGRAGDARRYVAGKVTLRFTVAGDGVPQDVLVIATDLGNYNVERCLVDMGRRVKFPPPEGHKAATFEYPVEFRSTHEMMQIQDLDDSMKVDRDVAGLMHSLAACGPVTETGASASFYIEPNGNVASVGLASEAPLNEQAGACLVKEMHRWKMSATLPGRVLRCRVNIPAVIASAEPVAKSTGRRRRH